MKLQEKDLDQLTAAMYVFIHSAERVVRELIKQYEAIDRDSQEYKAMVKLVGKPQADLWLHENDKQVMLQANGQMLHRWLDAAYKLLSATEKATDMGLMSGHDGVGVDELFGAMMRDSQMMIRLFLLNGNIRTENYDKVEQALRKLWDKDHHPVRSKLIEVFSQPID